MLEKFLNTLTNDFYVPNAASVQKIYSADGNKDKVTITLKFFDTDNIILDMKILRFTKNKLSEKQKTLFNNVSAREVETQFNYAKDEIITKLIHENNIKINKLNEENSSLQNLLTNGMMVPLENKVIEKQPKPKSSISIKERM